MAKRTTPLRQWTAKDRQKGLEANRKRQLADADVCTDRERALARGLVEGLSKAEAFRRAGYSGLSSTQVNDVLARPRVILYIEELRERIVKKFEHTVESLCDTLRMIADRAMADGQFAPAVSAIMGIAKMHGYLADRTEIEMHIISKPAREPTKEITLSPEEWQRQFAPKQIQ